MAVTPKIRRTYRGAPVQTTLGGSGVTSTTMTSISLSTSPSTWPTGKFFVVVAPGTASEEKMCVTVSGSTMTVVDPNVASNAASVNGRGVDNTTARSTIAAGSVVYPVATAIDFDDANSLTSTYANQGGIVYMGDPSFTQLGIGTVNQVLRVNTGATAPEWGQVATAGIADGAVTSAKIQNDTIVDADINSAAAISLSKLATGALPTAITVASANIVDGTIVAADIADGAVTSAKILDGTIVDTDINASAAIALSKLATGALPTAITVASANIVDGTIVAADIADGAVTSAKILDGTIVNADINASAAIALTKLEQPAWATFGTTANFKATTTNPNVGSTGSWTMVYQQIGTTVFVRGRVSLSGTGVSAGSGQYRIDLPVTAKSASAGSSVGIGSLVDSLTLAYPVVVTLISTTQASFYYFGASAGISVTTIFDSTGTPFTLAAGDYIDFNFTYEAA